MHEQFGVSARLRYEALIIAALRDIASIPDRLGSRVLPELGVGIRSWHLRMSREHARTSSDIIRQPRHFLIYRLYKNVVVIGRVLHETMELARHTDQESLWG